MPNPLTALLGDWNAPYDVSSCTPCCHAAHYGRDAARPGALAYLPDGWTATYDDHHNSGVYTTRPCDTCDNDSPGTRRVLTIHPPERTAVPRNYEMIFERTGVEVCTACLNAAVNGLHPDDSDLEYMPLTLVPLGYHLEPGGLIRDEGPHFSHRPCDTCHNPRSGDRHVATLMSNERVACEQCVALVRHTH